MKLLGVSSPVKNSAASLDLLNLYMVNQISCQRKMPETVRKPIHVNMNKDIKMPGRKQALELPMSPPCRPSNLCIDDLGNNVQYQIRGSKEEHGPVQLSNVYYSDSLASKLYDNRDVSISPYKAVQSVTSFQRLNSPGNVLPGRPAVTSEDDGSLGICTDKKPAQRIFAYDCQEKMPQKQSKKYPLHCMSNNLLEELHPKHSWDTQLGEVVMVEGQCTHVLKGHNSPQSSPCTSYSPQQTDSSFSSSSEIYCLHRNC